MHARKKLHYNIQNNVQNNVIKLTVTPIKYNIFFVYQQLFFFTAISLSLHFHSVTSNHFSSSQQY